MNWLLAGWTLTSPPMPKFFQSIASPPKPRKKPLRLGVPAHVPPVAAIVMPTGVHWPFVPGRVLSMPLELALSCAVPKPSMKSTELCALANGTQSNRRERMGRYRQIRFTSEVSSRFWQNTQTTHWALNYYRALAAALGRNTLRRCWKERRFRQVDDPVFAYWSNSAKTSASGTRIVDPAACSTPPTGS